MPCKTISHKVSATVPIISTTTLDEKREALHRWTDHVEKIVKTSRGTRNADVALKRRVADPGSG